jgi:hypothetical protein
MTRQPQRPLDVAQRLSRRHGLDHVDHAADPAAAQAGGWHRDTFTLPRAEAREKAREFFSRFPKAAYMSEIEWWRELDDGRIEVMMRRLASAD